MSNSESDGGSDSERETSVIVAACTALLLKNDNYDDERVREKPGLLRRDVPHPKDCAMRALLNGSDETYLFLFRMNKDCFKRLQTAFEPLLS